MLATQDKSAEHIVARSHRGTVCTASVQSLAASMKAGLSEADHNGDHSNPEACLSEYAWDVTANQVAEALQI